MSKEFKLERNVELCPESKLVAEKELRETPERVKESMARIRELLKENPDLYFGDDDEILTVFLRSCKWYPESALAKMRRFAEQKRDNAQLLLGIQPEDVKETLLKNCTVCVLPNRDHKRRRILIGNIGDGWIPSKASVDDVFKWNYILDLLLLLEPESQVNGFVTISDYHNFGWSQMSATSASSLKRQAYWFQEAAPWRMKESHTVRQPMMFSVLQNLSKPFIDEKFKKRMFAHGNKFSSLHKHIPQAYLPSDYGGELPPVKYDGEVYYNMFLQNRDLIKKWDAVGFVKK